MNSRHLRISWGTCKLITNNSRLTVSDKDTKAQKIWPRLDKKHAVTLLKLQRRNCYQGYCIIGTHARIVGLGTLQMISAEAGEMNGKPRSGCAHDS